MNFDLNNEGIDDFLKHISRLMDESDRMYADSNNKVAKYMVTRMKSCKNCIRLLCSMSPSMKKDFDGNKLTKLAEIEFHIEKLIELWQEKLKTTSTKCNEFENGTTLKLVPVYTGRPGRPKYLINFELVQALRGFHFKWETIADIFGIHLSTLWRRLDENGFDFDSKYDDISEDVLDSEIIQIKRSHPLAGERMLVGILRSKGWHLQRRKVRESIHRVDPLNTVKRWLQKNPRWVYSVPGPNSLWHNDGLHKMVKWGIVIHACIDGYSRMITSLICATNNYAETALSGFKQGVLSFGLPACVRGDRGDENVGILNFMREKQGYEGAYIQGPSVHNQRVERLHYDTTHCVLSHFIDLFNFMKENNSLKKDDKVDLFALHYVFVPRIQRALDQFKEGWNHHQLSTERNQSPYQLWLLGMMNTNKQEQRGVRRYFEDTEDGFFGIDMSSNLNFMPDDLTCVEVHDVNLENQLQIVSILNREFVPLNDENNFGISCYERVRERIKNLAP